MARLTIQQALDYCLANPDGLGVEELLAKFPEYRSELQPLLTLATDIQDATFTPPPQVPAERRSAMKARLIAAATSAAGSVGGSQSQQPGAEPAPVGAGPSSHAGDGASAGMGLWGKWILPLLRRPALVAAGLSLLLLFALWATAAGSLPNSPFYQTKLAAENFMLNFTGSGADRARAHLQLADARVEDIRAMYGQGKLAEAQPAIDNYRYHLDSGTRIWKDLGSNPTGPIAGLISDTVQRCAGVFNDADGALNNLPPQVRADVQALYSDMDGVMAQLSKTPPSLPVYVGQGTATPAPTGGAHSTPAGVPPRQTPHVSGTVAAGLIPTSPTIAVRQGTPGHLAVNTPTPLLPPPTPTAWPLHPSPTATSTLTVHRQPTPLHTRTPVPPTPVRTPPRHETETPMAQHTPRPTEVPTAHRDNPTETPHAGETPEPTHTPRPEHTPGPPPRTPEPKDTPRPGPTREPDTATPRPTHVPPNSTSTSEPEATSTPDHTRACGLQVQDVAAQCLPSGCASWTAHVYNDTPAGITASWTAELQVSEGGAFHTVDVQHGSGNFVPGDSWVTGTFCDQFSENANNAKIIFTLDDNGSQCQRQGSFVTFSPCRSQEGTPEPTNTPGRPPQTATRVPPTRETEPTDTPAPPAPSATPEGLCALSVESAEVSCAQANCVNWSASVMNGGPTSVAASWRTDLQIRQSGGQFQTVNSQTGSAVFAPGANEINNSTPLCYAFPPDVNSVHVQFTITGGLDDPGCTPHAVSSGIPPCR